MYVNQLRLFTECTKRKPQLADKLKLLFFIVFWFAVIANQGGMSRPLNCQPTREPKFVLTTRKLKRAHTR